MPTIWWLTLGGLWLMSLGIAFIAGDSHAWRVLLRFGNTKPDRKTTYKAAAACCNRLYNGQCTIDQAAQEITDFIHHSL
ncbi:hypothetical protein KW797_03980 [Candidatus Parcubacteria bacterium]|nr:hypothetical protein [Candidatus Parcubacteria bacterium]